MPSQLLALFTLAGTIIGAGIFALPYLAFKVNIAVLLLYFLVLGAVVGALHLIYAQIIVWTQGEGNHRLPGYAGIYFGEKGRKFAAIVNILGLLGALLVYLVIGSSFLQELLGGIFLEQEVLAVLLFFGIGALLVFRGIKTIAKLEALDLILLALILLMVWQEGRVFFYRPNLFNFEASSLFLPYGIVLFSLWGMAAVPEAVALLKNKEYALGRVFWTSSFILIVFYLLFAALFAGIMGPLTPQDALSGLKYFFDDRVIKTALFFGFVAVFTSFLTIGLTLEKILWYDFKVNKKLAWFLAMFVPLGLYFLGLKSLIAVLSIVGGILLGLEGLVVLAVYLKAKKMQEQKIKAGQAEAQPLIEMSKIEAVILALALIFGILYELQTKIGF